MKKIICFILLLVYTFTVFGCSNNTFSFPEYETSEEKMHDYEGRFDNYANGNEMNSDFYQKRLNHKKLMFRIAENAMQVMTDGNLKYKKAVVFDKEYQDANTYNVCFIDKTLKQNNSYPCVELDLEKRIVLRIYDFALDRSQRVIESEDMQSIESKYDAMDFSNRVFYCGKWKTRTSYNDSTVTLRNGEFTVTNDFLVLNADDFMQDLFEDDFNASQNDMYRILFMFTFKKEPKFCEMFYESKTLLQKIKIPYAVVMDANTGQLLGLQIEE